MRDRSLNVIKHNRFQNRRGGCFGAAEPSCIHFTSFLSKTIKVTPEKVPLTRQLFL